MRRLAFLALLALAALSGIEALQFALLGIALLLGGARVRVLLRRKDRSLARPGADPAPPRRVAAPSRRTAARDEWAFPDPHKRAPTGLLPSTASARRRARAPAMSGDRD
jgi:hypothetical protein